MTHLTKRNGVYYFRRKVPLELRSLYEGKAEIIFSLKTKNRAEAEPLARKLGVHFDEKFAKARAEALEATNSTQPTLSPSAPSLKPRLADGLTIDDFDVLVARHLKSLREQRELAATDVRTYEQFQMRLIGIIADNKEFLADGEHPLEDVKRPLWQVEAQLKAAKAVLKGKGLSYGDLLKRHPISTPAVAESSHTSLSELVERWARERQPVDRSVAQYKRIVEKLTECTGVTVVEQITKQDVVKFKDKLLEIGTTTITTNNYLQNLSSLFAFAISNAILETNPAQGIKVQVRIEDKKEREPFTVEQLNQLFASPVYSAGARPAGGKGEAAYWLPLLGLFTGARLNELCQLLKTDIRIEHFHDSQQRPRECWVMDITDSGEGQRLKNAGSKRRIPIHPALIELGLIGMVESSPGPRVFHELKASKAYDSISASWSKWFARYLTQVGIKTDSLVFHSFRHSFKFYARQNSIPDAAQYAIQGHSGANVGDSYGGSVYPLAPLVEAMNSYQIPRLVLPTRR